MALATVCSCADKAQELSTYWEGHDFQSLDSFDNIRDAEDKFEGYIKLLNKTSHKNAVIHMNSFLDSAAQNTVAYMVWSSWFEPYLHALQSPYKNNELFISWLDKVLEDKVIDDDGMMERLAQMRKMVDKNTVGSKLQDVVVRDEDGKEFMISELIGKKMLLLFVDADCPSCLESLAENSKKYKGTKLVAVLVGGSQMHLENIKKRLPETILNEWILVCGSQRKMETEGLYDLTYLPSRLLVSAKGNIIKSYH